MEMMNTKGQRTAASRFAPCNFDFYASCGVERVSLLKLAHISMQFPAFFIVLFYFEAEFAKLRNKLTFDHWQLELNQGWWNRWIEWNDISTELFSVCGQQSFEVKWNIFGIHGHGNSKRQSDAMEREKPFRLKINIFLLPDAADVRRRI